MSVENSSFDPMAVTVDLLLDPHKSTSSAIAYVGYVSVPLFFVVGIGGNLMSIVVMRSKFFRVFPVSFVLIALAISDTILNALLPFNKLFVRQLLGFDVRAAVSDEGCQAFFWAYRTAKMTSSWLVVLICAERFVAVRLPMKTPLVVSKKSAVIAISMVYIIIGTYNGVWVSYTDKILNGICTPNTKPIGLEIVARNFLITGLAIYAFIPATVLVVCTTMIIYTLYSAKKVRQSMLTNPKAYEDPTSKTTVMLLCVCVAFVLLVMPIAMTHLISFFRNQHVFQSKEEGTVVFREIAQLLEHLNYSINFFLYVIACPSFRKRVPTAIGFSRKASAKKQRHLPLHDSSGSGSSDRGRMIPSSRRASASSNTTRTIVTP